MRRTSMGKKLAKLEEKKNLIVLKARSREDVARDERLKFERKIKRRKATQTSRPPNWGSTRNLNVKTIA